MSSWRRKVLAFFPDLRVEAQRPDFSIYSVYRDLLLRFRKAHVDGDVESLRTIYGFVEWCYEQNSGDMRNAACVGFYEHMFDRHPTLWPEFVLCLPPQVVDACMGLWEHWLSKKDFARVQQLLAERREPRYEEARKAIRSMHRKGSGGVA